ncbi:MAG: hypothetical protein IKP40_13925 [Clostridia bacterium]|nr:hypothetical protein [Clostridia bacterium]
MRLIDADALKEIIGECPENWTDSPEEIEAFNMWHRIMDDIDSVPTIGEGLGEALDCFRSLIVAVPDIEHGIVCENARCKWRNDGKTLGLDHGYCAFNGLLAAVVRLLGGEPGKGVRLREQVDRR